MRLLAAGPDKECTHRALLALRILTIKEVDRMSIYRAGGIDLLVRLLDSGAMSEVSVVMVSPNAHLHLACSSNVCSSNVRTSYSVLSTTLILEICWDAVVAVSRFADVV